MRILFLLLFFLPATFGIAQQIRPGQLMIQLQSGSLASDFSQAHPFMEFDRTLSSRWNIHLFKFDEKNVSAARALQMARSSSLVRVAQFNHETTPRENVPNDPRFPEMWNFENNGSNGVIADADVDAAKAWDISTGGLTARGDTIVVAVIDDGFDINHIDLNFWKNYGEIPGDSIDNDGNGYIDDYDGWNSYNNNGKITSMTHGTHVAGTVGARGNNGVGVAGINWDVKVMAVQGSSNEEATVVVAYDYVFTQRLIYDTTGGARGAFVVSTNASFGVDYGDPADYPIWCGIYDSLGTLGILNAAATANKNIDVDIEGDIPTACASPFMISVTNTTSSDGKNSSAAYGDTTIDIGAPGSAVLSTVPGNGYSKLTGTSMATPHVAGIIALMFSAACEEMIDAYKQDPDSIILDFKERILLQADPIAALSGRTTSGGRLNLFKTLNSILKTCTGTGIGVDENGRKVNVSFNPNPASSSVLVSTGAAGMVKVQVASLAGQVHLTSIIDNSASVLDVSRLSPGVYFITFEGPAFSETQKLLIAR